MMKAVLLAQKSALCFIPVLALCMAPANDLSRYTECKLGRFVVVESSERDQPFDRSVPTDRGDRPVAISHGISLHIAYEETPFVNFKAEKLADYGNGKQALLDSLKHLAADPGMESAEPLNSAINGFDVYGINRKQKEGGVLSVYLLFRDADQTVITLYLLNTPPDHPTFGNMDQYRKLRDEFLETYTKCAGSLK